MEWFIFALLTPVAFAITNIMDKYILTKKLKDPFSYNLITIMLNFIPISILPFFLPLNLDLSAYLAILHGAIFAGLFVIYNKAMIKEEASRIVSLVYTFPVFVIILSIIFLQEFLFVQNYYLKYLGVMFLFISAILVSYKKTKKKFHLSSVVAMILFYSFGTASMKVLSKYVLFGTNYWSFFFWSLVGNLLGALVLIIIPKIRKNLMRDVSNIDKKTWLLLFSTVSFMWLGSILFFVAASMGFISFVSALMSVQPLIVFLIMLFLTIRRPKILKEEISKLSLTFKALAVILIIVGSYLIIVV